MSGKIKTCLLLAAMAGTWVLPCRGQAPSASQVQTLDALTPVRPEGAAAQNTMSVGHPDLGEIDLVNRQEPPKLLTLQTSQLFSYTSNAFLTRDDEHGSLLWNGRLAASVVPYATRDLTPSISFEENWFRYDRYSAIDFDTQTASFNLKWDLTRDDRWSTNSTVSLTRLFTSRFDAGDLYTYAQLNESITYVHQLFKTPIYTGTTIGGALRLGHPSVFDRWSIYLNSAAIYSPTSTVQLSVFARPELQLFTNQDGAGPFYGASVQDSEKHPTDFDFSAGASVTWSPLKSLSVGANFLYTESWSTYGPHEYTVYTPSISVTGSISF